MLRLLFSVILVLVPSIAQAQTWNVSTTKHFRVFHLQNFEYGQRVADFLEEKRADFINLWFGELPAWRNKCDVYLYQSHNQMVKDTGARSWMVGNCAVTYENSQVTTIRINARIDVHGCWDNILTHELMHALLGTYLGRQPPRWIDEGLACQVETGEWLRQRWAYGTIKDRYLLKSIIGMTDYPDKTPTYYGQSVVLVKHLISLQGEREFLKFVASVSRNGTEAALLKHYNATYDLLEQNWLTTPFQTTNATKTN
jgi:hypothetical protein